MNENWVKNTLEIYNAVHVFQSIKYLCIVECQTYFQEKVFDALH